MSIYYPGGGRRHFSEGSHSSSLDYCTCVHVSPEVRPAVVVGLLLAGILLLRRRCLCTKRELEWRRVGNNTYSEKSSEEAAFVSSSGLIRHSQPLPFVLDAWNDSCELGEQSNIFPSPPPFQMRFLCHSSDKGTLTLKFVSSYCRSNDSDAFSWERRR